MLFERYRRRVAGVAAGMVGDHARAEDISQEVFISALRRMRATQAPIAFKPWIYEIARNACIDSFRRSRGGQEISLDVDGGLAANAVARLAAGGPGPAAVLDDKQRLADLCGALGGLSEAEHDALVMRELEGRSYREIGERLQMGRPAVESTLFRARRKLEVEYQELRSGERCRRVQAAVAAASGGGRSPGARDSRRFARHVSHCQPCRRAALAAGVTLGAVPRSVGSRLAGVVPLPAFLRPDGGVIAHLLGFAEPAAAWTKTLAAVATVTVAGLGTGVAVEKGAGVTLGGAGGSQALVERLGAGGEAEGRWPTAAVAPAARPGDESEPGAWPGGGDAGAGAGPGRGDPGAAVRGGGAPATGGDRSAAKRQRGRAPRDGGAAAPGPPARRQASGGPAPPVRRSGGPAAPGAGALPGPGTVTPGGGGDAPPSAGSGPLGGGPGADVPTAGASPDAPAGGPDDAPQPPPKTLPAGGGAPSPPDPGLGANLPDGDALAGL